MRGSPQTAGAPPGPLSLNPHLVRGGAGQRKRNAVLAPSAQGPPRILVAAIAPSLSYCRQIPQQSCRADRWCWRPRDRWSLQLLFGFRFPVSPAIRL